MTKKKSVSSLIRELKRKTRKNYSSEDKIRIIIEGMRREVSVAEPCRQEGIAKRITTIGAKTSWRQVRNV